MKKRIPKSVVFYLLLVGFFVGTMASIVEAVIIGFMKGFFWGYAIMAIQLIASLGLIYLVQWKFKGNLEEWGMAEFPKVKQK